MGMAKQTNSKERTEAAREERDRIIMDHLPLVKAIAVRVHENLPVHVDLDDLVHAGILGLFDAVDKFQPEKQLRSRVMRSTGSRGRSWTACGSWTGRRGICGAGTSRSRRLRASLRRRCNGIRPSRRLRGRWASKWSGGAK